MKIKNIKAKLFYLLVVCISVPLLLFFIACAWIGYDVKKQCSVAKKAYGGDCVESLVKLLKDNDRSFKERNSAVWALGQLGDSRALPTLQSYYTGNIPDREPLNESISQYELKKAVNLTSGGANIAAWAWRFGIE